MSDAKPNPTDLSAPAEERLDGGAKLAAVPGGTSPLDLWAKARDVLSIEPAPLRRRAVMQFSVEEIEGLAAIVVLAMPVVQAQANLIAVKFDRPDDTTNIALARFQRDAAIYPSLHPETRVKLRRTAS